MPVSPPTPARSLVRPEYTGPRMLGAPVGDFSVFQTLLITAATGAASFFAGTFLGILIFTVVGIATHHMPDYSLSYRAVGLPIGIFMTLLSGVYLGSILVRRLARGGRAG